MLDLNNRVRNLAYHLWEEQGCPPGKQLEHWLEAERQLSARHAAAPEPAPPKPKRARKASKSK